MQGFRQWGGVTRPFGYDQTNSINRLEDIGDEGCTGREGRTFRCHSLETVPISSCVRIDVRVSAAENRVVDKHVVVIGPFIRNTANVNLYPSVVSPEILGPLRFRSLDHSVDDIEQRRAFSLFQRYPPLPA